MGHPDIYQFSSARDYLKQVIQIKRREGDAYSLRAIARRLDVSPSTLSEYINNKKTVSQSTALKLAHWLKLQNREKAYLELLFKVEATRSPVELSYLNENLSELRKQTQGLQAEEIRNFIQSVSVASARVYVKESTLKTRTLFFLKEVRTGKPVRSFCEEFFLPENGLNDKIYFIENRDGSFRAVRSPFHPQIPQDKVLEMKNKNLRIHFDSKGFPTVEGLYIYLASSDVCAVGSLSYFESGMRIGGRLWSPNQGFLKGEKFEEYRAL